MQILNYFTIIISELGEGVYGEVFLVMSEGKLFALKKIAITKDNLGACAEEVKDKEREGKREREKERKEVR